MDHNITKTGIWTGGPWEGFDVTALQKGNLQINPNLIDGDTWVSISGSSGSYNRYYSGTPVLSPSRAYTISYDLEAIDAKAASSGSNYYRIGAELSIKNGSGGTNYYGKWIALSTSTAYNFKGRLYNTFNTTSNQTQSNGVGIYIQGLGSGYVKISNLKIEEGSTMTPYVPSENNVYGLEDNGSLNNPIEANQFYEY